MPTARVGAVCALVALSIAACSGGSSPAPTRRTPPDLAAFLRLPVATPSACPKSVNGTTVGRQSPWVGHVDISVFVNPGATSTRMTAIRTALTDEPDIAAIYGETKSQAYAEFQRLYTCSDSVSRAAVPASYRLVLRPIKQNERDDLVRRIYGLPGVESVSCDPSNPCVNVGPAG